jgi:hypothetical protein
MLPEFEKFDTLYTTFEQKLARVKEFVLVLAGPASHLEAWVERVKFLQQMTEEEQLYIFVRPEVMDKERVVAELTKRVVTCGRSEIDAKLYGVIQGYLDLPADYAYSPTEAQQMRDNCGLQISVVVYSAFSRFPSLSAACSWRSGGEAVRVLTTETFCALLTQVE